MAIRLTIPEHHKLKVYRQLRDGSDPRRTFFLMVGVSTVIASLGLVTNSTAVVIGAMLVAPLMTPILGLALALVRGDAHLISIALKSETLGVAISIAVGAAIGLSLPVYLDATPEMLSRTSPQLLDLLVAVFSGFAGAYALVDEKLSPALPGVAISTAIVPPLANCGLSLAMGANEAAWGSFLLFFTNFLSILLVASLVFSLAGMGGDFRFRVDVSVARRFGVAAIGFIVIALLLTIELQKMVGNVRLNKEISAALHRELEDQRISEMQPIQISRSADSIQVLAKVNAPSIIAPSEVRDIQESLSRQTGEPVQLFVRTTLTHDISAAGTMVAEINESLDGFMPTTTARDPRINLLHSAEQVIREMLERKVGIHLESLEVFPAEQYTVLLAEIAGTRPLSTDEVSAIEARLDARFPDRPISFLARQELSQLSTAFGDVRVDFASPSGDILLLETEAEFYQLGRTWFDEQDFSISGFSMARLDDALHVLFEVTGTRTFSQNDYVQLQAMLAEDSREPVIVYVRAEVATVLGPTGHVPFQQLLDDYRLRNLETYPDERDRLRRHAR